MRWDGIALVPRGRFSGESETWLFYVWGTLGMHADNGIVSGWNWWGGPPPPQASARLELLHKPDGIIDGPAVATLWTTPPTVLKLPNYNSSDGLTGYQFRFTLTLVPKPPSILALAGGLAAVGGFALTRSRM